MFPLNPHDPKAARTSVEAGVSEMLTRMETGRLKVAAHLHDWWEEFRMYHRKDGKIVAERDDLLSATRYGIMDLRYAVVPGQRTGLVAPPMLPLDPVIGI